MAADIENIIRELLKDFKLVFFKQKRINVDDLLDTRNFMYVNCGWKQLF